VINTCAVTGEAASDSRGKIRHAARAGVQQVIATGCWATLEPEKAASLPNVHGVVPNERKDGLVREVLASGSRSDEISPIDREPIERILLPGLRRRTRAFIKVQDGCDNRCTFCITTLARGAGRSRPVDEVIQDIHAAEAGGSKEIVLTGVHLGSWGQDMPGGLRLHELVRAVLRETDVPRLRLSSLEPWDLDAAFFSLWENPRLMPHLHLPLQSGCASTLKRMSRKTTPESFRALVSAARQAIPRAAITTDIIAGFPGETEEEFRESLDFVREMEFAGGHVFSFSPRPGTGAARMREQVHPSVRKQRNHTLHQVLEEASAAYRRGFVGEGLEVLWESASELGQWGWQMEGLAPNYLRVTADAPSPRWNQIDRVEVTAPGEAGLRGVIRDSG
jgi:threonylcarbamoyladenosine tRNA methylthiotransferase MtaB